MVVDNKRSFTVNGSSVNHTGGRYISNSPYGAAKKAASQQFKKLKAGQPKKVKFMIKETTQGSDGRSFFYVATRTKLSKPTERIVKFKGVEKVIKNEYTTKLEKCNAWAHDEK